MNCRWCGGQLVEVDNPFRREVRHRRGQEVSCPGPPESRTAQADTQAHTDEKGTS